MGLYIPGEWSWRLPCIVMIVGPICVLAILIKAPESPRFLVHKDKLEKAMDMLAKYHANGDRDDPLVKWEFNEINASLGQEEVNSKSSYVGPQLPGYTVRQRSLTM